VSLLGVEQAGSSSSSSSMMQIFIETDNGRKLMLEARYTDTIATLKTQIQDKEGIPPAQQCLIYDRMALDDARTLAGCGIQRESTLYLHLPGSTMSGAGAKTQRHRGHRCDVTTILSVVSLCLGVAALAMGNHVGDRSSSDNAAALDRLQQLESQHAMLQSEMEKLKGSTAQAHIMLHSELAELVPYGSIVLWNSTRQSIPVGWVECDGQHGTPDLRDRFVVGAGPRFPQGQGTKWGIQHNASFQFHPISGLVGSGSGGGRSGPPKLKIDFGEPIPAHHALVYIMRTPNPPLPLAGREPCNPTKAGDMDNNVTCETCNGATGLEDCCKLYHITAAGDTYNCFWDGQTCTNQNVGNNPCAPQ
jgi:hypothetical protein